MFITPEIKEYRRANNLCFGCGIFGHSAGNCKTNPFRRVVGPMGQGTGGGMGVTAEVKKEEGKGQA